MLIEEKDDRRSPAFARAVRRRMADHRLAAQLAERGWTSAPPEDEIEKYLRRRTLVRGLARSEDE